MHTYKLDTINYKDGEFHVRFVLNSEPIAFVVSGKNAEKFFDALKAIDYKTDKMSIDTYLKKYGNNSDKVSIGGDCIECEFESDPEQDNFMPRELLCPLDGPSFVKRIKMGVYNGKPLNWIYLGHYDDETDLFLSEDIICKRQFDSKLNDWFNSELAKWLSVEITNEAFLLSEYRQLVPLKVGGLYGFKLFLLSNDEYEKYRDEIPNLHCEWWLRSQGYGEDLVAFVKTDGSVRRSGCGVRSDDIGVRPALRLRRS